MPEHRKQSPIRRPRRGRPRGRSARQAAVLLVGAWLLAQGCIQLDPETSDFCELSPDVACPPPGLAGLIESNDSGDAELPRLAVDPDGSALAVWQQWSGERFRVWANRYRAGAGWQSAEAVSLSEAGDALAPRIGVDAEGHAIAVWQQGNGTSQGIWTNRYRVDEGWGTAEPIALGDTGDALAPELAMDPEGNALAVWKRWDGTRHVVEAARYSAAEGWGPPTRIEGGPEQGAGNLQLAMDADGIALALWDQAEGAGARIWASRYAAGEGWSAAVPISSSETGNTWNPRVALTGEGRALAVWQGFDGIRYNLWASELSPEDGWGPAEQLQQDPGQTYFPELGSNDSGQAVVVWEQWGRDYKRVRVARYNPIGGWSPAETLTEDFVGDAQSPKVTVDPWGNAAVAWAQWDGFHQRLLLARYSPLAGWELAGRVDADEPGDVANAQIFLDSHSEPLIVWQQSDGARTNIWSNRPERGVAATLCTDAQEASQDEEIRQPFLDCTVEAIQSSSGSIAACLQDSLGVDVSCAQCWDQYHRCVGFSCANLCESPSDEDCLDCAFSSCLDAVDECLATL